MNVIHLSFNTLSYYHRYGIIMSFHLYWNWKLSCFIFQEEFFFKLLQLISTYIHPSFLPRFAFSFTTMKPLKFLHPPPNLLSVDPRSPTSAIRSGTFSGPFPIAKLRRHQLGDRPGGSAIGWWVNRKWIYIVCLVTMVTASPKIHMHASILFSKCLLLCFVTFHCPVLCATKMNSMFVTL